MGFTDIAAKCRVSSSFVMDVCERKKILSESEMKELSVLFREKGIEAWNARFAEKYQQARKLLQETDLSPKEIAKKLRVSKYIVLNANKGKGSNGTIRDATKIHELKFGLKPINSFSTNQKLELIEPWKKTIVGKLGANKVPQKEWDKIIGSATDALFRDLNYFDPQRRIPVEHFISAHVKRYIRYYSRPRRQKTFSLFATKRGEIPIADKKATAPPEAAGMKEILSKVGNLISPLDKDILLKRAENMPLRKIGAQYGLSREMVRVRANNAMKKLKRHFKTENKQ